MGKIFRNYRSRLPGDTLNARQQEWLTWYEGVPERLAHFYSNWATQHTANGRFWGSLDADERAEVLHMPLAGDIAAMSADLIFSEPAEFTTEGNEERLQGFVDDNKLNQRLLHASEMSAAVGGIYLKIDIDADEEHPVMSVRYPNKTTPKFKANGDLKEVTFKRKFFEGDKEYCVYEYRYMNDNDLYIKYKVVEIKESGKEGKEVELDSLKETEDLENVRYPDMEGLGAVYIPNSLPNKMFPESDEGISDFGQVISLLDALDESWTSWINDITIGKGRAFVDQSILKNTEGGKRFDPNQKAYIQVDMGAAKMGEGHKPIESIQHAIRAQEHLDTCIALTSEIVMRCGYAPQSFGLNIEGNAQSGTAIRLRERKSMLRKQKKSRYWAGALKSLLFDMQMMDTKSNLASNYNAEPVEISFADSITNDPRETSETIRNLSQAQAISTKAAVQAAHPDWGEDRVDEEVKRINEQRGAVEMPSSMVGG